MTRTLTALHAALAQAISAAQDHAATLYGDERFHFDCWLHDLMGAHDELRAGAPFFPRIPSDPMEREDALDRIISPEKAA